MTSLYELSLTTQYAVLGVPALLTIGTEDYDLRVIDLTVGVDLDLGRMPVPSLEPVAAVRISQLIQKGFAAPSAVLNAAITFNGGTWEVVNIKERPTPHGAGEAWLILREVASSE